MAKPPKSVPILCLCRQRFVKEHRECTLGGTTHCWKCCPVRKTATSSTAPRSGTAAPVVPLTGAVYADDTAEAPAGFVSSNGRPTEAGGGMRDSLENLGKATEENADITGSQRDELSALAQLFDPPADLGKFIEDAVAGMGSSWHLTWGFGGGHWLCGLLSSLAEALDTVQVGIKDTVAEAVGAALHKNGNVFMGVKLAPWGVKLCKLLAAQAAKLGVARALSLPEITMLARLCAVWACPDLGKCEHADELFVGLAKAFVVDTAAGLWGEFKDACVARMNGAASAG